MLKIRNLVFVLIIVSIVIMGFQQLNDKKYLFSKDVLLRCCNNSQCNGEPCNASASISLQENSCYDIAITCAQCMDFWDCNDDSTRMMCSSTSYPNRFCYYIDPETQDSITYYGNCENLDPPPERTRK